MKQLNSLIHKKVLHSGAALLTLLAIMAVVVFFNPFTVRGVLVRLWIVNQFRNDISFESTGQYRAQSPIVAPIMRVPLKQIDFKIDGQYKRSKAVGQLALLSEFEADGIVLRLESYADANKLVFKLPFKADYSVVKWDAVEAYMRDTLGIEKMDSTMSNDLQVLMRHLMPKLAEQVSQSVTEEVIKRVRSHTFMESEGAYSSRAIVFTATDAFISTLIANIQAVLVNDEAALQFFERYGASVEGGSQPYYAFVIESMEKVSQSLRETLYNPQYKHYGSIAIGYNAFYLLTSIEVISQPLQWTGHLDAPSETLLQFIDRVQTLQ